MKITNLSKELKKQEKARLKQVTEQVAQEFKPIKEKIELIEKLKQNKGKMPKKEFYDLSCQILCWNSPAYCCKSGKEGKPCIWRGTFLELNNLTLKDFEEMKSNLNKNFLEMIEKC